MSGGLARNSGVELTLTVLGCDGSWAGPGGAGSSYLVRCGPTAVLLDCGPGAFSRLQQHLDPEALDAVVLSHQHPDHWTDLYSLATQVRFASDDPFMPVFAPAGLAEHARLSTSAALDWRTVTGGDSVLIGALRVSFWHTDHDPETLAMRVDGPASSLGYSADTGPDWSLAELGSDLDLVLCEATFTVDYEGTERHLSGRQAGAQARSAGSRRLVLTHRRPTTDARAVMAEAQASFGRSVEQAITGKEFVL